jgi:hypothetical protein
MISHTVKKQSPRNTYEKWKRDGVTRGDEYFIIITWGEKNTGEDLL